MYGEKTEEQRIVSNARRICEHQFLFDHPWDMEATHIPYTLEDPIDWTFQPLDDPEWTFMLARHGFVLDLARAYILTGDNAFTEELIHLITSFFSQVPLVLDCPGNCWRSLDSAIRMDNWVTAVTELGQDSLPSTFMVLLHQSVLEHSAYLASVESTFLEFSNWGLISNCCLYHAALWLSDERWESLSIKRVVDSISCQILADGVQWEQSPMYHGECLHALLKMIEVAKKYGRMLPHSILDAAQKMCHASMAAITPNGHHLMQNDSDDTCLRDLLGLGAVLCSDPVLRWFGPEQLEFPHSTDLQSQYNQLPSIAPDFLSSSLRDSGNYYLRSGWDEAATMTHFRCGALGSGHGHADLLHVDFIGRGHDILVDAGRYTYVDGELRRLLRSASSHNTVILDNKEAFVQTDSWGYSQRSSYAQLAHRFLDRWGYCAGISLGYMDGSQPMMIRRDVVQIDDDYLCIFDRFMGAGRHWCSRMFHFSPNGDLEIGNHDIVFQAGNVKASLWFDPQEQVIKESSFYSPHYNLLLENSAIKATSEVGNMDSRCMIVRISDSCTGTFEEIPVVSDKTNNKVGQNYARAFVSRIEGEEDVTVLFSIQPSIEGVDLLKAGQIRGYGSVIVRKGDRQEVFSV